MADVAIIFHWSPQVMDVMTIVELLDWWDKAIERLPKEKK